LLLPELSGAGKYLICKRSAKEKAFPINGVFRRKIEMRDFIDTPKELQIMVKYF